VVSIRFFVQARTLSGAST